MHQSRERGWMSWILEREGGGGRVAVHLDLQDGRRRGQLYGALYGSCAILTDRGGSVQL